MYFLVTCDFAVPPVACNKKRQVVGGDGGGKVQEAAPWRLSMEVPESTAQNMSLKTARCPPLHEEIAGSSSDCIWVRSVSEDFVAMLVGHRFQVVDLRPLDTTD